MEKRAFLADRHKNRWWPNLAPSASSEMGSESNSTTFSGLLPTQPWLVPTGSPRPDSQGDCGILTLNTATKSGANTFQNGKAQWCPGKNTGFTVTLTRLPPSTSWWHSADLGTWSFMALASVSPLAKHKEPFQWFGFALQAQKALWTVISDVDLRSMDTLKGTSHRTNDFYPDLHSRLSHISTRALKFRFRCQSRDVGLALRTNQVHMNESTVQTVEVKVRTGHWGFSAVGQSQRSPQGKSNSATHRRQGPSGRAPRPPATLWGPFLPYYSTSSLHPEPCNSVVPATHNRHVTSCSKRSRAVTK